MKISDTRCGWTVEGRYIDTITAGERPSEDEVLSYYGFEKDDPKAAQYFTPTRYDRIVILKDNGSFVIAPKNPDMTVTE